MSLLPDPTEAAAAPAIAAPLVPPVPAEDLPRLPAALHWKLLAWLTAAGDLAAAAACLDAIGERKGESAKWLEAKARLALLAGDPAEAVRCWERRLAVADSPSARAAFVRALIEAGQTDRATAEADALEQRRPDLIGTIGAAAEAALARGDAAGARRRYEALWEGTEQSAGAAVGLARAALLGGDRASALDWLDRALAVDAEPTAATLAGTAAVALMLGQVSRAAVLRHRLTALEVARARALVEALTSALDRPLAARVGTNGPEAAPNGQPPIEAVSANVGPAAVSPRSRESGRGSAGRRVGGEGSPGNTELPGEPTIPPAAATDDEAPPLNPRVLPTLRAAFGYDALRPGQEAVIARVLAGQDTLAILPTGAGKSLTFQLPSLLLDGTTLVLSPLIALMKDQVDRLPAALRERTALLNSTLSPAEQHRVLDGIAAGDYSLVYAAPERLRQGSFLRALRAAGVALVAVDEAHCIALWGHDFRPDYLSVPAALPELGDPPVLAITATATPETAAAISAGLGRRLTTVRTSSFRPNLFYAACKLPNREAKVHSLVEVCRSLCREGPGAGIVYVSSRRDAETFAGVLRDNGVAAVAYHAGMDPTDRGRAQDRFMRGHARVVVATVAFGMGIDKKDVRFIVHVSPPTSLEAYAQESGRAGRDGEPSRCVLLFTAADRQNAARLARRDAPKIETLRAVYRGLRAAAVGPWAILDPSTLAAADPDDGDDEPPDPRIALNLLAAAKLVRRHPNAPVHYDLPRARWDRSARPEDVADPETWDRVVAWLDDRADGRDRDRIPVAAACAALGLTPERLGLLLEAMAGDTLGEGPRLPCYEILPAGADAALRMGRVLAEAERRGARRVAQVVAYAEGRRCRHAMLAEHFGEPLAPCGTACDVCTGTVSVVGPDRSGQGSVGPERSATTAADARAALEALRSAPFGIGKKGLTLLLRGSVESRIQDDRSRWFGALADVRKSAVDKLIDRLVEAGFLRHDDDGPYRLLTVTPRGRDATDADLEAVVDAPRPTRGGVASADDVPPDVDVALLERLYDWRRERAAAEAVPAYVVAPNKALEDVARLRPRSPEALARAHGFGPSRIERYGDDILAIVRQSLDG